jgi:hypothetical protein
MDTCKLLKCAASLLQVFGGKEKEAQKEAIQEAKA